MAAPTVVIRGKAAIEGIAGTFDAILYALQQTGKMTNNFEEEIIKDVHGYDAVWLARNEHVTLDISLKLVGDTAAHAAIPATTIAGPPTATVSNIGQPFLTPFSAVTLSGFPISGFNGVFQVVSGFDVDLANTKVGDLNIKLRAYANADQRTASTTTPT